MPLLSLELGLAPIIDQERDAFVSCEVFTPVLGFFLCSLFVGFSSFFVCLLAAMILDSFFYSNYLTVSVTNSVDMNLSRLWKIVKDRGASCATVHGLAKSQTRLSI